MEPFVLHRWKSQARDFEPSWKGLKDFIRTWYGDADEYTVRERLRKLHWKETVEQLDRDWREALDICTTIADEELTSTFVAHIPEVMRAYWLTKEKDTDRYIDTVATCLRYERKQQMWRRLSGTQHSSPATARTPSPTKGTQGSRYLTNCIEPVTEQTTPDEQALRHEVSKKKKSSNRRKRKTKDLKATDGEDGRADEDTDEKNTEQVDRESLQRLAKRWPTPTCEEWQTAGATEVVHVGTQTRPAPPHLQEQEDIGELGSEDELLLEVKTDAQLAAETSKCSSQAKTHNQTHRKQPRDEKMKLQHDRQKNKTKWRSTTKKDDEHRCCESQGDAKTVQEAQQKEEASCMTMTTAGLLEGESKLKNETTGSRRLSEGVHAQAAFSPLLADVQAPSGEALGPLHSGGNNAHKAVEGKNDVQEKADIVNSPQLAASSATVEAQCRCRSRPSNSTDICEHSMLATRGTSSYQGVPDSTQQYDPHSRTSCKSHHQSSPSFPCPPSPGPHERQADTSPTDASHRRSQCTNLYSTKHKQDFLVSAAHALLEQCALDTWQKDGTGDEAPHPQQAAHKTGRTRHPQKVQAEEAQPTPEQGLRRRTQQKCDEEGDLERSVVQDQEMRGQVKDLVELETALAAMKKNPTQQCLCASSSSVQQPSPAVELKDRTVKKHHLQQHSSELQLKGQTMKHPTKMLLGNGDEMKLTARVEDLECTAGELYFKINAVLAPIPFDLILGQTSLQRERLLGGFGPTKLTGWRGGRRLDVPITKERLKTKSTAQNKGNLWKGREDIEAAQEALEKVPREKSREEAEALVPPSPKGYKNFKLHELMQRMNAHCFSKSNFVSTCEKFDTLARHWQDCMPRCFLDMLLKYRDMFPDSLRPGLPARRVIDYRIPTVPDKLLPKGPIYQMGHTMKMAMKDEFSKLATKGYITLTSSAYAAPCMLVPKKADKPGVPAQYRLVINYRELNKVAISSEQPIPNITTIMEQLRGAKYFTTMDMESGFPQVRVAPEEQHRTGFRCYLGHFEFKVMPFGSKGAPRTFQAIMSHILWEHIGVRCAVYLTTFYFIVPVCSSMWRTTLRAWRWRWKGEVRPFRINSKSSDALDVWLSLMLTKGFLERTSSRGVVVACRHFTVPKPHKPAEFRVVGDFRPLNKLVEREECEYPRIEHLWARAACEYSISVADVRDGFYQVRVPYKYRKYFGLKYQGQWYRYTRLPQGFVNAPCIFMQFMFALLPRRDDLVYYMDDVIGFNMASADLEAAVRNVGLPINEEKTQESRFSRGVTLLGVQVYHREGSMIVEPSVKAIRKVGAYREILQERRLTKREFYALAGLLQFMRLFIPNLSSYLDAGYEACRTKGWDQTIEWDEEVNLQFPFRSQVDVEGLWKVYVDASLEGVGLAACKKGQGMWSLSKLIKTEAWRRKVGVYKEVAALEWAIKRWCINVTDQLLTDSQPVVLAIKKGEFKTWPLRQQKALKRISEWNIVYTKGKDNLAEAPSRPIYTWKKARTPWERHLNRVGARNLYRYKKQQQKTPPP
ncbi:hypothetical protein Emed_000921 [Eimeria media]